ncbi:MAG: thioredoxin family protein [Chitinophagaceae bacterium]|nr:thioredoxin family protein [Chitinophagaceae bacterium]
MKLIATLALFTFFSTSLIWKTNIEEAKTEAAKNNKVILVNFSGSDWCSPCIMLKKKIFESEDFTTYATSNLVLVNADFPRQKKHTLSNEQKKLNDDLAAKYNPEGNFPFTLLLTANGRVIKSWDGLPDLTSAQFVDQVKQSLNVSRCTGNPGFTRAYYASWAIVLRSLLLQKIVTWQVFT